MITMARNAVQQEKPGNRSRRKETTISMLIISLSLTVNLRCGRFAGAFPAFMPANAQMARAMREPSAIASMIVFGSLASPIA
jgi:hypothetical protein